MRSTGLGEAQGSPCHSCRGDGSGSPTQLKVGAQTQEQVSREMLVMSDKVWIWPVQHGSHQPHVAAVHLKRGTCVQETETGSRDFRPQHSSY